MMTKLIRWAVAAGVGVWMARARPPAEPPRQAASLGMSDILHYIATTWDTLTRSMTACDEVLDPKEPERSVLYLPAGWAEPRDVRSLALRCGLRVAHLPQAIHKLGEIPSRPIEPPGLLYLPHPYVVPGGRFNEMYGWDSYFIIRGLLADGRLELARGIVENFFFEIDHYGGVLNANRTYYLTRSQPPFLSSMVLAVEGAEEARGGEGRAWLERAYPYIVKDYQLWVSPPHLAGNTGLSRYYDFGDGPVPEMADSPGYYRGVARYFLAHPRQADSYLIRSGAEAAKSNVLGPLFSLDVCEPGAASTQDCDRVETLSLSRDFYKGDRAMRESGFDVSFRSGPYGAATHHYAAVDLNSLLYKTELDLAQISRRLGRTQDARAWRARARRRQEAVNRYLWNAGRGLYFDYNFDTRTPSSYPYLTAFYPLWTAMASPSQAAAVERHLKEFEQPGGLATSLTHSGAQWDYPYGWAPLHLLAVEGLRRYGYAEDANRISLNFLSMVLENFRREGTMREKYDVVTRSSETQVAAGYTQNVVGFGWTNGVFVELLHELPEPWVERLSRQRPAPAPQPRACLGRPFVPGSKS